jgi:hypothetical protein
MNVQPKDHEIDPVDVSKRRVAVHLLRLPPYELSNAVIATALGWTVEELLDFYREDKPNFVRRG